MLAVTVVIGNCQLLAEAGIKHAGAHQICVLSLY